MSEKMNFYTINQIKELIKHQAKAKMLEDTKLKPIFIQGHAGIGKTAIQKQIASELSEELNLDVECKVINMQFMERPDLMGMMYREGKTTHFAQPDFLPKEGYGILFLDEANRVDYDIRGGFLSLLEDRAINGHELGRYWIPVLAGNPQEEGYETEEFDTALSDRIIKVGMLPNPDETYKYFVKKYGEDNFLVSFLKNNLSFLSYDGKGISPRTFEYGIKALESINLADRRKIFTLLALEFNIKNAQFILKKMHNDDHLYLSDETEYPHLTFNEIKDILRTKYNQLQQGYETRPLFIEGVSGIGKTSLGKTLSEEVQSHYLIRNMQFMERPDFMGLQFIENDTTYFARPKFLPEKGQGIILFDEANRVESDIRSGFLTLLEDKNINGHEISKNYLIYLAGNHVNDDYETEDFDIALKDRMSKCILKGSIHELLSFFNKKYKDHFLVRYLEENHDIISFTGEKYKITPRSFEYAIKETINYEKMNQDILELILRNHLGISLTNLVINFLNQGLPCSIEKIFNNNGEYISAICNENRNDIICVLNKELVENISQRTLSEEEVSGVKNYMHNLKEEHYNWFLNRALAENDSSLDRFFADHIVNENEKFREFIKNAKKEYDKLEK
jgi:MoxR-like ATPase